ncbi:hypothetical protein L596_023636 [Steinernema carpocapsae]|uniref:Uncharacterized protein n=1 Tax=Steinernema carpocapsae TaxID=34508 RepID=A0A4U5ME82_STECR|nr:hypothetical protein L596_023636 [Steinernema carpocapsae]
MARGEDPSIAALRWSCLPSPRGTPARERGGRRRTSSKGDWERRRGEREANTESCLRHMRPTAGGRRHKDRPPWRGGGGGEDRGSWNSPPEFR